MDSNLNNSSTSQNIPNNQLSSQTVVVNQSGINNPIQNQQDTPNKSSSKKIFFIIFILICFIGVGIGVVSGLQEKKSTDNVSLNQTQNKLPTVNQQQNVKDISPVPLISLSDNSFLTYKGKKAKYSFSYPKNWPTTEVPAACGPCIERLVLGPTFDVSKQDSEKGYIPPNAFAFINILKMNIFKSFEQKDNSLKISENRDKDVSDIQYISIAGERAISNTYTEKLNKLNNPRILRTYWLLHDGVEYNFTLYVGSSPSDDSERIRIFGQILSSFQFLQ